MSGKLTRRFSSLTDAAEPLRIEDLRRSEPSEWRRSTEPFEDFRSDDLRGESPIVDGLSLPNECGLALPGRALNPVDPMGWRRRPSSIFSPESESRRAMAAAIQRN